jgi:hypothetical protein
VEYFNCLSSVVTNDARRTREIKPNIAVTEATAFNKKNITLCGAENLTLRKVDQKYFGRSEM